MEIQEITKEEVGKIVIRSKWKQKEMLTFARDLHEQYNGKIVKISMDDFYNDFYSGENRIKYINYYCKKHLQECFKDLDINTIVSTTKDRASLLPVLIVQFRE